MGAKNILKVSLSDDFKIDRVSHFENGEPALILSRTETGEYDSQIFNRALNSWVSGDRMTQSEVADLTYMIAVKENIKQYQVDDKIVSFSEFNRSLINVGLKNHIPIIQLNMLIQSIEDWTKIHSIVADENVSKYEYKKLDDIARKNKGWIK
ncbi:MAG: hypothetical protein IAE95_05315 [Chitinophagaceae bacterium]|nr:hypothetical protein [Chitinophagaceae bacterium]